jgi:hypothetical protein
MERTRHPHAMALWYVGIAISVPSELTECLRCLRRLNGHPRDVYPEHLAPGMVAPARGGSPQVETPRRSAAGAFTIGVSDKERRTGLALAIWFMLKRSRISIINMQYLRDKIYRREGTPAFDPKSPGRSARLVASFVARYGVKVSGHGLPARFTQTALMPTLRAPVTSNGFL